MNFVSTLGAAALSCILLPAAFASGPADSTLESSSAAIAPEVREVEKPRLLSSPPRLPPLRLLKPFRTRSPTTRTLGDPASRFCSTPE